MRNLFVFFCFFFIETICFADNHIPVEVTPEHFGCISNDKRQADNNSIALQNAINYCIKNGSKLVSIASNAYYISKGLTIPGYINIDLGGATLIATAPMSMVTIHYDKTEYWTGTIRNFRLNATIQTTRRPSRTIWTTCRPVSSVTRETYGSRRLPVSTTG